MSEVEQFFSCFLNKKLLLLATLVFGACLIVLLSTSHASAFSGSGTGISGDAYLISSCAELQEMQDDLSAYYELDAEIDCTAFSYTPVGTSGSEFSGTFDGLGHSIGNLIVSSLTDYVGVFGATANATIQNVSIENSTISGPSYIGAIAGTSFATSFTNIRVTGTDITSTASFVGGIVGQLGGASIATSSLEDSTIYADGDAVGGLVGYMVGPSALGNSFSDGTISSTGQYVGGIVGQSGAGPGYIENVFSIMTFSALSTTNGGLVGFLHANTTISNSFSAATMPASGGSDIGAAFGTSNGAISGIYFDEYKAGRSDCSGTGSTCSAVNNANSTPTYFFNNSTNAPLNSWDFGASNPWHLRAAGYPALTPLMDPYMLCEMPVQTLTTIHGKCDTISDGWGINTWEAAYQIDGASDWAPITLADIYVAEATVTGTSPYSNYKMRFRFTNDWGTGSWGTLDFTQSDTDSDAINDLVEAAGPNSGDANNDGTADRLQANVTSALNTITNTYLVLKTTCNDNFNFAIGAESSATPDAAYNYPAGLVRFVGRSCGTPGASIPVTIDFYGSYTPANVVLRKSNGTTYETIQNVTFSALTIGGQAVLRASYAITDGGPLDQDGIADGNIVDPVGLATAASLSTSETPSKLAETGFTKTHVSMLVAFLLISLTAKIWAVSPRRQ